MIQTILKVKDYRGFLSTPCEVLSPSAKLMDIIVGDLLETANCHKERCAGLAANQISYPYKIFVMKFGKEFMAVANPVILSKSEKRVLSTEGCLSIPGRKQKVMRHKSIKVKFFDPVAKLPVTRKFKGRDAIIFQHEFDHGEGRLI